MEKLLTDQTVLAMFPIVGLGIIATIVGLYYAQKERRESREQEANHNR